MAAVEANDNMDAFVVKSFQNVVQFPTADRPFPGAVIHRKKRRIVLASVGRRASDSQERRSMARKVKEENISLFSGFE